MSRVVPLRAVRGGLHPTSCSCSRCRPAGPADRRRLSANRIAALAIAGLIIGAALTSIVAELVHAPSVAVIIGATE